MQRDRAATEDRILEAVGAVLARDGFSALGVNAIAKQAGVDKVLIYRYFGGLPELLRAWGESGRFWPSVDELLRREPELLGKPAAERYTRFFEHFIDELRARPLTLELSLIHIFVRARTLGEPGSAQRRGRHQPVCLHGRHGCTTPAGRGARDQSRTGRLRVQGPSPLRRAGHRAAPSRPTAAGLTCHLLVTYDVTHQ